MSGDRVLPATAAEVAVGQAWPALLPLLNDYASAVAGAAMHKSASRADIAFASGLSALKKIRRAVEGVVAAAAPQPQPAAPADPDDSLLLCASDLEHSAIYDNHQEMAACIRAIAGRIKALAATPPQAATQQKKAQ